MAQRVFGPVRGAGVQVTELEGEKPIEPGALGIIGYAGLFEKGMVGNLNACPSKTSFLKKMGSYIEDGQAPDAAIDYYDIAAGAGGGYFIRVTDGNELPAEMPLYCRKPARTLLGKLKAKNGGRWGGKADKYTGEVTSISDFTNTTVTTGVTDWTTDQWKGGVLEHPDVPNKQYEIIGNTAAGVITLAADSTLEDDIGSGTDLRYYLILENEAKELTVEIRDGEENPSTEFGLFVYVDGELRLSKPNLALDPADGRYWESLINDDDGNDEVEAEDLWTGGYAADVRPANHYAVIDTVTETILTAKLEDFTVNSPGGADPTLTLGTTTDLMVAQKITCTMTAVGTFDAVSDKFGELGSGSTDSEFTPNNKWTPPFTITEGTTPLATDDVVTINYKPFVPDELIDGYLFPDKVNASRERYRIVDNDHKTITVADGSDLTASGATDDEFMVQAPLPMSGGRDGNADVVDADYNQQAWDTGSSPFNQLLGKNVGLVKMAAPGVTATAVQKAGIAYVAAKNHQYRIEVPSNIVTEDGVDEYVNDTIGRSDYGVVSFPSYRYVADPLGSGEGKLKLATATGEIHGREAAIARDYLGYHKAEAGEDATLPKTLKLPTGDTVLNEEILNPRGIGVIKKVSGNFVIWGDRTVATDPNWKWKHQRELMSYYENVLRESYNWIVFAINDPIEQPKALTSLQSFFLPEWRKRALRGDTFVEAATLKIDAENNTDATMAAGDMFADILLKLADTVERFRIRIGKQGIFEAVV